MLNFIQWLKKFILKMQRDKISVYAAQSAYFIILSFFPFVMFLLILLNYLPIETDTLITELVNVFPDSSSKVATWILNDIISRSSTTLLSITILALLWTAGKGLMALTCGLNSVHEIEETRNYFALRIISTFYTILLAFMVISALIFLVFGNWLYLWIIEKFPILNDVAAFVISIRTFASLLILTSVFTLFYKMLPAVKVKLLQQIPGALFAAVGWLVFSYFFSIYINYAQNLSYMYGGLVGIIILMLWLYFCMNIIFIGAEINFILYRQRLENNTGLKY
ncbi:MAG TPA: YihY/virulence factor BrkB family protein [Candidatus Scybalocola faecipullorum]|nr:YihY/virulence factor BrkB family protein [Candidatus Scybalocola faecipullorum]